MQFNQPQGREVKLQILIGFISATYAQHGGAGESGIVLSPRSQKDIAFQSMQR
jgi:hypothetical protein